MDKLQDICDQILREQREFVGKPHFQPAEDYLAQNPSLNASREHAVDVIFNEFVLRREAEDENVSQQEFYERFPEYVAPLKRQFLIYFGAGQISELIEADTEIENAVVATATVNSNLYDCPGASTSSEAVFAVLESGINNANFGVVVQLGLGVAVINFHVPVPSSK